ncbi:MAG: WbqC family protein [Candidatus Eremiobacteraeota bacterium]|nr:WbqC family protein [Candidatus Eremiobacteraeota bacterium]
MKVVVLQPSFLPWQGHLDQYAWCDRFVLYDDVQFDKHGWRNRNRILTPQGVAWLSIPVRAKGAPLIRDVEVDYAQPWRRKHLESLRQAYSKAPFFDWLYPELQAYYAHEWSRLLDWDVEGLKWLTQRLGMPWKGLYSSDLGVPGQKTERLIGICQKLAATEYLTGDAARDYLDESQFEGIGVKVRWHGYQHPVYAQRGGEFVSHLSIVDLMFQVGPDSLKTLQRSF